MNKKFTFEIKKEAIVSLTRDQQRAIRGGGNTDAEGTCNTTNQCDMEAPVTEGCGGGGPGNTQGCNTASQCNTVVGFGSTCGCPPNTSMAAGCSGTPDTHFGCNTAQSNCWLTKSC